MRQGAMTVDGDLRLLAVPRSLTRFERYSADQDVAYCMEGVRIMANMMARVEDEQTCMTMLGLTV